MGRRGLLEFDRSDEAKKIVPVLFDNELIDVSIRQNMKTFIGSPTESMGRFGSMMAG